VRAADDGLRQLVAQSDNDGPFHVDLAVGSQGSADDDVRRLLPAVYQSATGNPATGRRRGRRHLEANRGKRVGPDKGAKGDPLNWARQIRELFEATQGRILPTDWELLTINQAMILTVPKSFLTRYVTDTPDKLVSQGLIPADKMPAKSRCQQMWEAAATKAANKPAEDRHERRRRRREAKGQR
jgi:hypothetical protein